jgi:hypothetical protein
MKTGSTKVVRCAIYTRVSTDQVTADGGIAGGAIVFAGGADAAGVEAAISSCAVCGIAPITGGSLGAGAVRPASDSTVVLSSAAGASRIDDGAVSFAVALLTGATLGVGSLGSTRALAGIAAA